MLLCRALFVTSFNSFAAPSFWHPLKEFSKMECSAIHRLVDYYKKIQNPIWGSSGKYMIPAESSISSVRSSAPLVAMVVIFSLSTSSARTMVTSDLVSLRFALCCRICIHCNFRNRCNNFNFSLQVRLIAISANRCKSFNFSCR